MATEVELKLLANVKAATDSVQGFAKSANSAVSSVSSAFTAMAGIAVAAIAGIGFKKMIDAAIEADDSVTKLNVALKSSGDFSDEASKGFQTYASAIQSSTKFSEDAVLSNIALSKSYGLTNDQAKKVSQAALQLATVQGTSLDQATKQLAQTFDGTAGKLNQTIPALRNLTAEQLRAGAAADLIAKQFAGAAEAAGATFSGSLTIAGASFGEIIEGFGKIITQNPVFIKVIQLATQAFNEFASFIDQNKQSIADFVNAGLVGLVNAFGVLVGIVSGAIRILTGLATILVSVGQAAVATIGGLSLFDGIGQTFAGLAKIVALASTSIVELIRLLLSIPGAGRALKSMGTSVEEVNAKLDSVNESAFKFVDTFQAADIAPAMDKASQALEGVKGSIDEVGNAVADKLDTAKVKVIEFGKELDVVSKKPLLDLGAAAEGIANGVKAPAVIVPLKLELEASLVKSIGQGAAGAAGAVANVVGKIADSFLPGIGGIATEIINILAQGPEKVREFITGFIGAIPQIIENIILSVPALITALIDSLPVLIDAILASIPTIINGLIAGIPQIITALVNAIPAIIQAVIENLPKIIMAIILAIPHIIQAIISSIPTIITSLISHFPELVKNLFSELVKNLPEFVAKVAEGIVDAIKELVSGVVTGPAKAIGGFLGFSSGGMVPGTGNSDSVPTMLTPGEIVIPKDIAGRMLGGDTVGLGSNGGATQTGNAGQMIQVVLQIGEKQLAEAILNLNRQGFRTA